MVRGAAETLKPNSAHASPQAAALARLKRMAGAATPTERATEYLRDLQNRICASLEALDGRGRFREDLWQREGGGGGRTRVLAGGAVFEKAGVNFSDVFGQFPEEFARQIPGEGRDFTACGVSLVVHPRNPFVPTVHANFRFLTKGAK